MLTLSMTSAFAKGGDNDWISDLNIQQRLKSAKQVKIVIKLKSDLNSFFDSTNDFTDFIGEFKGSLIQSLTKERSVDFHSFCLQAKNYRTKKLLSNVIREELRFYSGDVSIETYNNLIEPCN